MDDAFGPGMGFGPPREAAEWLALALGVAAAVVLPRLALDRRRRLWLGAAAATASLLSLAYVSVYLRGGPRIIDATSYWLEARSFARGWFGGWPLSEPEAATVGRFLVRARVDGAPGVAVIFPPGYPAVLAVGFLARAPMLVGPLLAAALCLPTWHLGARAARALVVAGSLPEAHARAVAPTAALLAVTCAALRYHTADTMSHGLAALCMATAVACALRSADGASAPWAAGAGVAGGWLLATRPVSGAALAVVGACALLTAKGSWPARARLAAAALAGAAPGALLLLAHQRAITGSFGASSQSLYYALSDGPPGCFQYGFGDGVGCLGEHGDFVRARLAHGFGALAAAGTTLRRLKQHLVDPANFEPLAMLVPLGAWLGWRARSVRWMAIGVGAHIAAYVPFYFDGNYPGGGARFFADVLPLELALAAVAAVGLAARLRWAPASALLAVAASLVGFALRAGREHAQLRDREGGRPMFEPAVVRKAGADDALLFVDTDHGFDLAAVPARELKVARWRGDALDWMAWDAAGRPRAYRYRFEWASSVAQPSMEPLEFPRPVDAAPAQRALPAGSLRIEGESLWPPRAQRGAWALPEHAAGTCASGGKWLRVRTPRDVSAADPATVELVLPAPWLRGRRITPVLGLEHTKGVDVVVLGDGRELAHSRVAPADDAGAAPRCLRLETLIIPMEITELTLTLQLGSHPAQALIALDHVEIGDVTAALGEESR